MIDFFYVVISYIINNVYFLNSMRVPYYAPKYHPWVTTMAIITRLTRPMGIR